MQVIEPQFLNVGTFGLSNRSCGILKVTAVYVDMQDSRNEQAWRVTVGTGIQFLRLSAG